MNIKETLSLVNKVVNYVSDMEANDVLGYVGLQRRRTAADYILPALGVFAGGVVLGAAAGVLLAPKAGADFRQDLTKSLTEAKDMINTNVATVQDKVEKAKNTSMHS